jgi:hypothetical protein
LAVLTLAADADRDAEPVDSSRASLLLDHAGLPCRISMAPCPAEDDDEERFSNQR